MIKKFNIDQFKKEYLANISNSVLNVKKENLEKAYRLLEKKIKEKRNIFFCGNGGSAAISNHFVCDFQKGMRDTKILKPKITSLSSNVELITAIANDFDYSEIFSHQAQSLCRPYDLIIIVSSSGNSKNIVNLLKYTKKNKIYTIGLSGFSGGKLKADCNISLHVETNNYGIVEDSHQILLHILYQFIKIKNYKIPIKKIIL
jgi:D-sedoheptulose 7-phosphate isomerase